MVTVMVVRMPLNMVVSHFLFSLWRASWGCNKEEGSQPFLTQHWQCSGLALLHLFLLFFTPGCSKPSFISWHDKSTAHWTVM